MNGLCKRQVARLVQSLLPSEHNPHGSNREINIATSRFKKIDALWEVLDRNGDDFASFTELGWLVEDVGESMKEMLEGWLNLMLVVRELGFVVSIFLCLVIGLVYASFFVKDPSSFLTPLWTTVAGLSFAIQGPVKAFTDACVFVFAQHPYDIGDWIRWGKEKELKLVVDEIHLMHTTFHCVHSGKMIQIPHSEISAGYIENLSRTSKQYVKSVELQTEQTMDQDAVQRIKNDLIKELSDEKLPILRYHHMPEISTAPTKPERVDETAIRIQFCRRQGIPDRTFKEEEQCREKVMGIIRKSIRNLKKDEEEGKVEKKVLDFINSREETTDGKEEKQA